MKPRCFTQYSLLCVPRRTVTVLGRRQTIVRCTADGEKSAATVFFLCKAIVGEGFLLLLLLVAAKTRPKSQEDTGVVSSIRRNGSTVNGENGEAEIFRGIRRVHHVGRTSRERNR